MESSDSVVRAPVARAEKMLTELRTAMRDEGGAVKSWASELMPAILILREALE